MKITAPAPSRLKIKITITDISPPLHSPSLENEHDENAAQIEPVLSPLQEIHARSLHSLSLSGNYPQEARKSITFSPEPHTRKIVQNLR